MENKQQIIVDIGIMDSEMALATIRDCLPLCEVSLLEKAPQPEPPRPQINTVTRNELERCPTDHKQVTMIRGLEFERELEQLLNRHCQENASHTPDFVLASLLRHTLDTWNLHTKERDRWFGNRSLLGPGADDKRYPPVDASEKSLLR